MSPPTIVINSVSVMCESFLIGAYAVLVGFIIYIIKREHQSMPKVHKILFSASIFMFVISVVHLGLVMEQVTKPVIPKVNFQVQVVLSVVQYITGDLILIWRVWVIWGRKHWIVIAPLATLLVSAGFTLNLARYTEERDFFTVAPVAMIVANTLFCTLLIAGRIWYMEYQLRKINVVAARSSGYKGVVALVIETGAIYALAQLILDRTGSVGLSVMLNLEIPLIGILPTLIIVLVHFQRLPGTEVVHSYVNGGERLRLPQPPRPPIPIHFGIRSMSDTEHGVPPQGKINV